VGTKNLAVCSAADRHIATLQRWKEVVSEYSLFAVRKSFGTADCEQSSVFNQVSNLLSRLQKE